MFIDSLAKIILSLLLSLSQPVGVVMGDSIAEGYPLFGRLNIKEQTIQNDDQPGQISYELKESTGITWYNHAIRGQTTVKILERWCRDVLDEDCDPGDGFKDTLPVKPRLVIISAGINDVYQGVDIDTTISNLESMVTSAKENSMEIIVYTLHIYDEKDDATLQKIDEINEWIIHTVPTLGGHVYRYDLFCEENEDNREQMFIDNVHPSKKGHQEIARELIEDFPFLVDGTK
mgnify:CR=1 FL=1|jgi:Lysophospholipase L1 and related esterases